MIVFYATLGTIAVQFFIVGGSNPCQLGPESNAIAMNGVSTRKVSVERPLINVKELLGRLSQ